MCYLWWERFVVGARLTAPALHRPERDRIMGGWQDDEARARSTGPLPIYKEWAREERYAPEEGCRSFR